MRQEKDLEKKTIPSPDPYPSKAGLAIKEDEEVEVVKSEIFFHQEEKLG